MKKFNIARPDTPYSSSWVLYNEQNPHLHRSVGAAGTDDDGGAGGTGTGTDDSGDGGDAPTVESLQAQMKLDATKYATVTGQLESLTGQLESFKNKHHEAEKHKKEQERLAKEAVAEAARKSGDVAAIEESWNEKYTGLETSSNETIASLNQTINEITVGAESASIATEIAMSGSAPVLIPHIKSRLTMDLVDGKPVIKVLKDGKPSALTIDDLKNEIMEDKAFAPIIKASNASGAGGAGNGETGASGDNVIKRSEFDKLTPPQQAHFMHQKGAQVVD